MKFWVTTIFGVVALSALGSFLFIRNPDMQKRPKVEAKVTPKVAPENAPIAEVKRQRDVVENLPQMKKGKSVFEIKNVGKSALKLTPGRKSCTCLGTELDKESIAPGETAQYTLLWDTANKVGDIGLQASLETNDPLRGSFVFETRLHIIQDVLLDPPDCNFGRMREGDRVERTVFIIAPHFENFEVKNLKTTSTAFEASWRKMTAGELAANNRRGKSGAAIHIKCDGKLPVGEFQEQVQFNTNYERLPEFHLLMSGQVEGKTTLSPAKLDFGAILDPEKTQPLKQVIFAAGLGASETLRIGSIEPNYVAAELARNKDFPTNWTMMVRLTKDTPAGDFKCWISLVDSKGEKKISVPVTGIMPGALELVGSSALDSSSHAH